MTPHTAREIIMSRLLILQSKRLLLSSIQRRVDQKGLDSLMSRAEQLRRAVDDAQHAYRTSVLDLGSPAHDDYWLVAYSRLIETGVALVGKLRTAAVELPPEERYHVSADVEMLEEIVKGWTESKRKSMSSSVA